MSSDFSWELIQQKVSAYRDKGNEITKQQCSARQSACERFLEQGITAYWLLRNYEDNAQEAARSGISVPPEVVAKIEEQYRAWMGECARAEQEIRELADQPPDNLGRFQQACAYVKSRIAAFEHYAAIDDALSGRLFTDEFIQQVERTLSH